MKSFIKKVYLYFESIPDRLYPFREEIEGHFVRGRESYQQAVKKAVRKYGKNRLGYTIQWYRGAWHFIGSVLFIVFSTLIAQKLLGSEMALYVMLVVAILALFFQEFYAHPRRFNQPRRKSITDWLTWVVPMVLYMIFWL